MVEARLKIFPARVGRHEVRGNVLSWRLIDHHCRIPAEPMSRQERESGQDIHKLIRLLDARQFQPAETSAIEELTSCMLIGLIVPTSPDLSHIHIVNWLPQRSKPSTKRLSSCSRNICRMYEQSCTMWLFSSFEFPGLALTSMQLCT
jgi:hypothetical protein